MKISMSEQSALLRIVERFPRQHIVVLGDLVADEFIYGEIARVSREAPVLILKQREKRIVPGGGANAANNLVDLEARVTPVSAVGADEAGDALVRAFQEKGVSMRHVLRLDGYVTPTKSRVLGVLSHGHPQQIVRVDREPQEKVLPSVRRRLTGTAQSALGKASALLVSDYGYGVTNCAEVDVLRRSVHGRSLPLTVDSRYDFPAYTHVTAATPNEPEVEEACGERIGHDLAVLHRLGRKLLRRQSLQALLVTRGREGMALFEPRRSPLHLPIFGSDQVADVTGAGDTVIATFTLALAGGASFLEAATIANCAAGLVVMKRGTATVTRAELEEAIRSS